MIINLISGPRNVSTALMYSFAQRPDTRVVDEPFYACYLSKTGTNHPGKNKVLQSQSTDADAVIQQLRNHERQQAILFIKNMAHHLARVSGDLLQHTNNVFLIRNPREMITSFIKTIPSPTLRDTAYQCQHQQFRHVTKVLDQDPIVIDSAELLKNPRAILQEVCSRLAIPFTDRMLSWQAGPIPEDGVWACHWYQSVHQTTGFKPYQPKNEPVSERLQPLLKTCQKHYQALYKHAIKAPVE